MNGALSLEPRARLAIGICWIFACLSLFCGVFEIMEARGAIDIESLDPGPLDVAASLAYVAFMFVYIASVILIGMWIHRAHARLHAADVDGLEFSPGWAVGWYFVPFANLFKPFQAMKELWTASVESENRFNSQAPTLLVGWWATWIIGNILSNIGFRMQMNADFSPSAGGLYMSAAGTFVSIVCALYLVRIIAQITEAQESGRLTGKVFE